MLIKEWLSAFEQAVGELLSRWYSKWEFNLVEVQSARDRFFTYHPTMNQAMWTLAHFRFNQRDIYSPDQAAALWFNECCLPFLMKDKQDVHENTSV